MKKLAKKATVAIAGMAVASGVDSVAERPKGMNPTLTRIGVVVVGVVAWEFVEALLERKLGLANKS